MKQRTLLVMSLLTVLGLPASSGARGATRGAIEIGQAVTINSKTLKESRRILIHVPRGYGNASARYPVLYVLDGDEYFLPTVGIARYLAMYDYLPEMLVVGIPHGDRIREFTPTKDARSPSGGDVEKFLGFINDELFPYVENRYRTQPYRILSGHSLGGLCALYAFTKKPEMFNAYIAISSSVYWDNGVLIRMAEPVMKETDRRKMSVYLSVEAGDDLHIKKNMEFAQMLGKHPVRDLRYRFSLLEGESHTSLWVKSIDEGLRFVSPRMVKKFSQTAIS